MEKDKNKVVEEECVLSISSIVLQTCGRFGANDEARSGSVSIRCSFSLCQELCILPVGARAIGELEAFTVFSTNSRLSTFVK